MNRNPFYFDERAAEKSPLVLAANEQDRQLSEKFGLLTSHRSMDSFEMMPQNSSSRDPLATGTTNARDQQQQPQSRFHFLRQWFVGGGVEIQQQPEGSISPYEVEEQEEEEETGVVVCSAAGKDIELRRFGAAAVADEFVDDGVDLGMDFEEEINDLVAAYPHYCEALEAAAELQSLRRRELEFGSDSSSLQRRKGKGKGKGGAGGQQHAQHRSGADAVQRRSGCQCCACFRAPSVDEDDEDDEEQSEADQRSKRRGGDNIDDQEDDGDYSEGHYQRR